MKFIERFRRWRIEQQIKHLYQRHAQLTYELAEIGNKIRELKEELKCK